MKNYILLFNCLLWMAACVLTHSCQQLPEDDMSMAEKKEKSLKVEVRSAGDAEIVYPLYLYAFDEEGKLAASQMIEDAETDMALMLSKGDYQIVALSGVSGAYQLPENPDLDDVVTMNEVTGADTPMMRGQADVRIADASEASVKITLKYAVAALNVTLKDVPKNVISVQLALSPLYSTLSMSGEYGGKSHKVKVDCSLLSDGVWTAKTAYIFPGSGKETVFSVYFETEEGTAVTYGHTSTGIPEANHPFNVTGTYAGGIIVGGNFDVTGWEEAIDVEFEFGANVVPDDDEGTDADKEGTGDSDVDLTGVPEVGTIWNDMIVVGMGEADETGMDLLLMTVDEWEVTVAQAASVPVGYSVNGISDWRIPTHDEAAELRTRFSASKREELNEVIAEYDETKYGLASGDSERYLCLKDGTYYSFRFVSGTSTTKAGEKRSYYLRLVKTYRFELNE